MSENHQHHDHHMDKPMEEGQTIHHEVFDEIHNYNSRPDWITEEVVLTDSVQS